MKIDFNLASIWAALVATGSAMLWLFTNIAWAGDIERLEARMIRQEIRELRKELLTTTDPSYREALQRYIQEAIDDLCAVAPQDRECG